jgi:hypothetical protein
MAHDEIPLKRKDPNAIIDYDIDWNPVVEGRNPYLQDDETISTSTWLITEGDDGALILSSASILDGTRTKVFTSGGTVGAIYRITNRIVTSLGRTDDRSIRLLCQHR